MKITQQFGNVRVEINADTLKEALIEFGEIMEVFGNSKCGNCSGDDIIHKHRVAGEFDFYESECQSCYYRIQYGQMKVGNKLWAKRRDAEGNPIGANGWVPAYKRQVSDGGPVQQQVAQTETTTSPPPGPETGEDDIPF